MTTELNKDERIELDQLRADKEKKTYLKVSQKGALSLYGLQKFPVTLYKEQWETVLGMADEIQEFINENDTKLKTRD